MTFDEFLIEQTSRGEEWHAQAKTTGIEFARAAWAAGAMAERTRCVSVCKAIESTMRASYKRAPNQYVEGMCDGAGECADEIAGVA